MWYQGDDAEEEEDLMFSPALMARRASESWISAPPIEAIPAAAQPLQRKKSLPDVQALPRTAEPMSREEASQLSTARREYVRRVAEEDERLRANPLLYLVNPRLQAWFCRRQLVLVVIFLNIALALFFYKILT